MKPEEIFTENDFDFFEDLFELECISAYSIWQNFTRNKKEARYSCFWWRLCSAR